MTGTVFASPRFYDVPTFLLQALQPGRGLFGAHSAGINRNLLNRRSDVLRHALARSTNVQGPAPQAQELPDELPRGMLQDAICDVDLSFGVS
eukprot:scaffold34_cov260-Pinguiococcus_pyrenoidosus.AAC.43